MKNAKTKKLDGGLVKITPKKGYTLQHTMLGNVYSEAIIKDRDINKFIAVPLN